MRKLFLNFTLVLVLAVGSLSGQDAFNYSLELEPVNIPDLPGLHSYAFAQHEGRWLIIGGRTDGLHARQPMNSFPESHNNTDILVIDPETRQFWSSSLDPLPVGIREQLQSTNMEFHQDGDTLYFIGGYAFSAAAADHITFPNLATIRISGLMDAVMKGEDISPFFKQIEDDVFAVTGGALGKIGDTFYLVGGHRFDGRYSPFNNTTFTQTYTNQIRKFRIDNSREQLSYDSYSTITDPVHLRRRDYNLLPQVFPDGTAGYTISSGVFQIDADLPFLYPVDIAESGHKPVTGFNQYLSNYHSAKACLYDSLNNQMHSLFFGGMSQYYYQNGNLVQDDNVPFVKTISRLTRFADGTLQEYQLPVEMPGLKGSSAEFIPNKELTHFTSEIINFSALDQDTVLIGHIYGGITSNFLHPFTFNQTDATGADPTIYAVKLIRDLASDIQKIEGENPYNLKVYPNPANEAITLELNADQMKDAHYFLTAADGRIVEQGRLAPQQSGLLKQVIPLNPRLPSQLLTLTVVVDHEFFLTEQVLKK